MARLCREGLIRCFSLEDRTVGAISDARWPANVCHDGSPEVLDAFARFGSDQLTLRQRRVAVFRMIGSAALMTASVLRTPSLRSLRRHRHGRPIFLLLPRRDASRARRLASNCKPVALMEWLVRLVTPPGGSVLDPFCGHRLHARRLRPPGLRRARHRAGRADRRRRSREDPAHAGATLHRRGESCPEPSEAQMRLAL